MFLFIHSFTLFIFKFLFFSIIKTFTLITSLNSLYTFSPHIFYTSKLSTYISSFLFSLHFHVLFLLFSLNFYFLYSFLLLLFSLHLYFLYIFQFSTHISLFLFLFAQHSIFCSIFFSLHISLAIITMKKATTSSKASKGKGMGKGKAII